MTFQSAPACERATRCWHCNIWRCFNPRPRASGRPSPSCVQTVAPAAMRFQSAPACERATMRVVAWTSANNVSIRARVRAGDRAVRAHHECNGFNPRPRASGRPLRPLARSCSWFQSAPACERATRSALQMVQAEFQSAPACERATLMPSLMRRCFNPRPRASGRLAPCALRARIVCFNPRPRASGRHDALRLELTAA